MRRVNYEVENKNGIFKTISYIEATKNGNKILRTFLTEVNTKTKEEREADRIHAAKVREKLLNLKRG